MAFTDLEIVNLGKVCTGDYYRSIVNDEIREEINST